MEKFVTIIEQCPVVARNYTAHDGTQKSFYSKGFILTDGIDEFYAEMTGEMAREASDYDMTLMHRMQGFIRQRSFTDKNGQTRYENQIIITRMH